MGAAGGTSGGAAGAAQPGSKRRILVVDDEEMIRSVATRILERMGGYATMSAPGGAEALALLADPNVPHIDAVLIDQSMPGMDGAATLAALRTLRPGLPAIVSSGHDEVETLARCPQDPPPHFVPKPFTPEALLSALRTLLG